MAGGNGRHAAQERLEERYAALIAARAVRQVGFSRRRTASASVLSDGSSAKPPAKEQATREQARQIEAWNVYDSIGEVMTLVDGTAGLLAQCRFFPGIRVRDGQDMVDVPVEDLVGTGAGSVTQQQADDIVTLWERYTDDTGSQAGLVRPIAQNYSVVGRCKMVGYLLDGDGKPAAPPTDPEVEVPDGFIEVWQAVAPTSLRCEKPNENRWSLEVSEGKTLTLPEPIVYDLRWSHPRRPGEALGWVMAALDVVRDLRIFTLAQRSAARSGIPADMILAPLEASPKKPAVLTIDPEGDGESSDPQDSADQFATELEDMIGEFVLDVMHDADSGLAAVPAVLALTGEFIDKFDKISFSRAVDRGLGELVNQARTRLSEVADCPPEMLKGLGDTNRWNGGQIAEQEYRRYFKPKADSIADAFTAGPFRHSMRAANLSVLMDTLRLRVLVDPSDAVAQPDYSKLALGLMDRFAVGPKGVRRLLRIPESYAPSPAEIAQMIEWKSAGKPMPADNPGKGDQGPPTDQPSVDDSKGHAVVRGHVVETKLALSSGETLADQLLRVEVTARGRLEEAAEAALDRSLDRAAAKLRGWARKDARLKPGLAAFEGRPPCELLAWLGPERAKRLANDNSATNEELWAAALAALLLAFRRIAREAYAAAQAAIGATVPAVEIEAAITRAEQALADGMMELANEQVFTVPPPAAGEVSQMRVPTTLMRRVLAIAGGALGIGPGLEPDPESAFGLTFGPLLDRVTPEVAQLEWFYGPGMRLHHFEPHQELDASRFTGPTDPALSQDTFSTYPYFFPGDHRGCQCSWRPIYISDADGDW